MQTPEIYGRCDARFARVRDALARNFAQHGELGAAVAVELGGRAVVDLWGGWADESRSRAWRPDTLVNVFSVGKAVAAVALLREVERGRAQLDVPVARAWPEFAQAGKEAVTPRMVLAHRAGVPGVLEPLPDGGMYDWALMTSRLAAEPPWWEPGRAHGYHVNTFGFLVGELVRRASGEGIAAVVRREIAEPLGADFHFGVGPEQDARVADYLFTSELVRAEPAPAGGIDPERARRLSAVYQNPPGFSGLGTVNTRAWRAAVIPSTNGHASARGVARFYSPLAHGGAAHGVRLLAADTLAEATAEASVGPDAVLLHATRFGLGFQLSHATTPMGPSARSFGHFGAGGSVGFADREASLAFAYVMNRAGPRRQNPRVRGLIDAVYASL